MQTIASLKEGDWVEEIYLVTSKQVSTAKNGVTYLSLKLADKTGEIDGRLWDNADEVAGKFEREDFVRIKGMASNYQGSMQIKMKTLEKVDDSRVDIANFLEASPRNPDDIGKVRELAVRKSIGYTTEGRLIGHISLGYEMLVEKVNAIPGFPQELAM